MTTAIPTGGSTYCCVASFALAGRIAAIPNPRALRRWLVSRQVRPPPPDSDDSDSSDDGAEEDQAPEQDMGGFQGRIGKDCDACYSFWCSAALKVGPVAYVPSCRTKGRLTYQARSFSNRHIPCYDPNWIEHGCTSASTRCTAASRDSLEQRQVSQTPSILLGPATYPGINLLLTFRFLLRHTRRVPQLPRAGRARDRRAARPR